MTALNNPKVSSGVLRGTINTAATIPRSIPISTPTTVIFFFMKITESSSKIGCTENVTPIICSWESEHPDLPPFFLCDWQFDPLTSDKKWRSSSCPSFFVIHGICEPVILRPWPKNLPECFGLDCRQYGTFTKNASSVSLRPEIQLPKKVLAQIPISSN